MDDVMRMDSQFALARHLKGMCLPDKNQHEGAVECCDAALRIDPELESAHAGKGDCLQDMGRLAEAARCYGEAVRLEPDLETYHEMGECLWGTGDYAAAYCHADAHRLFPKDLTALASGAGCLIKTG